jgi:hypothetical protein
VPLIAFYRYALAMIEFAAVVVAALTLDELVRRRPDRLRVLAGGAVAAVLVGVLALVAKPVVHTLAGHEGARNWAFASVAAALAVVALVTAGALLGSPRARGAVLAGALVLESAALFGLPQLSAPRGGRLDLAPVAFLQENLGTGRFYTLGPIQPSYGSYFGIRSINVNDLPVSLAFARYVSERLDPNAVPTVFTGANRLDSGGPTAEESLLARAEAYREIGVRYVVTGQAGLADEEGARRAGLLPAFESDHTRIYELTGTRPYWEAPGCTVAPGDGEATDVDCPAPTRLVRRELLLPGWSATVAGAEVPVHAAGELFQAVDVPAGRSRVAFAYHSPYNAGALALFVAGLALLAGGIALGRRPSPT